MKKLICDRCGAEFSFLPDWAQAPDFEYRVQYIRLMPFYTRNLDLCLNCQNDLNKWLLDKKNQEASGGDGNG